MTEIFYLLQREIWTVKKIVCVTGVIEPSLSTYFNNCAVLFTGFFAHLHYNVFESGCEAISG